MKKINNEIPLGSHYDLVLNFLGNHKIDHSEYSSEEHAIIANKGSIDMIFNFTENGSLRDYKISEVENNNIFNITEIKNKIQSEIKLGSTPDDVISYLKTNNYGHCEFYEPGKVIYFMIRNIGKIGLFVVKDLQIIFKFSDDKKLVDILFKEVLTGV